MYILEIFICQQILCLIFSEQNTNPSPRTGPQNLLVTYYEQQHFPINSQQHFPQRKYIIHKFLTEIKIDLIANPSTKVI